MTRITRRVVLIFWTLLQFAGLVCAGIFVSGVARNAGFKEAVVPLDLSGVSESRPVTFHLWRGGRYTLYLTTVNHDPAFTGQPFAGSVRVRLSAPRQTPLVDRTFDSLTHRVPSNMEWTTLQELQIDRGSFGSWALAANVVRGDRRFAGMSSRVLLRKYAADEGWSALVAFAMSIPAAILSFIALVLAVMLQVRGGSAIPTTISIATLVILLAGWIAASTL